MIHVLVAAGKSTKNVVGNSRGEDIVIEPSKIKEEFEKIESENYKFRTYLKNRADIDELDDQFLELHNELFKNYDCSKCRNCCFLTENGAYEIEKCKPEGCRDRY